uniref:Retrovirus-related Pol polyprotein from transposon 17.6 n=1 Tax=Noccaea caerulescens TaxID=107243 RepID=A0A1J3K9P1_NOCCA
MLCVTKVAEEDSVTCFALQTKQLELSADSSIMKLVDQFSDIFAEPKELPPFRDNHNHRIQLVEGENPVNQRPYRSAVHQKNEIDKIVQEMLSTGTIQPSSSSFASPVVLVKKKDGTWWLCVDYRGLNGLTVKDRFPIPLIDDLMDELGGSTIYSKIDLRAGYHQVRMSPPDIHKTAFKTHSGHFEYLVMPFGLTNAPATFQGLMNATFQAFLRKFVLVFFYDILVYKSSVELHLQHLHSVFEVMRGQKLFAKQSKCSFATTRVKYLGHFIDAQGISTDPAKVQAIAAWPIPTNLKQLRGFLGLAGYYWRFVKNFGTIARPLPLLTKKDAFVWSDEAQVAFTALKTALCTAPVLALPLFDRPFVVETDACGQGIGAVLMQDGHPLAYISRHLQGKQLHLSIYEKELLAVVFAVQKWRHYLLTGQFVIKTDQRSLKYLLEQRLNTPIQQQWLPKLLEFDYEIQYKEGKENLMADALSRVEGSEILHMALSVLDCDLLKRIQEGYNTDSDLKSLISLLKETPAGKKNFTWSINILRRKNKLVVPNDIGLRDSILEWLHYSGVGGHSGRDATH